VLGGRGALTALVVVISVAVVLTAMRAPGSELDEGIMVTFPTRVEAGDLPYRDFETFYGPAAPYLVAAAFEIAGPSLATERTVGLLLRLVLVLAVFLLIRRWGNFVALCCAAVTLLLVGAGSEADAGIGADAFVMLALLFGAAGTTAPTKRWCWVAAGLAAGVSGLFRPEVALISLIAMAPLLWPDARRTASFVLGIALGLLPYVPLALAAGYDRLGENISDLRATGSARRLPLPALSTGAGRALVLVICALVLLYLSYWVTRRRAGRRAPVLLSLALLGALQFPYGLWRADEGHVIGAGIVPLALAPLSVAVLMPSRWRAAALAASLLIVGAQALPSEIRGEYARNLRITVGLEEASSVSNGRRSFIIEDSVAADDLQSTIDYLVEQAPAGSRLFVGPRDLRRTNTNDVMLYYLLSDLVPATFYLEMDPPFSRTSSRLARDVASADFLVLSTRWDRWDEPNDSSLYGPGDTNRIVETQFCRRASFGTYSVWKRCAGDSAGAAAPAEGS